MTTTKMPNIIGKKIRDWRRQKDMSQIIIAKKIGCCVSTISQYENGKRQPSITILTKIAGAIGINIEELIKEIFKVTQSTAVIRKTCSRKPKKETTHV